MKKLSIQNLLSFLVLSAVVLTGQLAALSDASAAPRSSSGGGRIELDYDVEIVEVKAQQGFLCDDHPDDPICVDYVWFDTASYRALESKKPLITLIKNAGKLPEADAQAGRGRVGKFGTTRVLVVTLKSSVTPQEAELLRGLIYDRILKDPRYKKFQSYLTYEEALDEV